MLAVRESPTTVAENDWSQFFGSMKSEIDENVKGETTGQVEALLSASCIMHAFKPYFNYRRIIECVCEI